MFRYTVTYYDSIECETLTEKGLLTAADYGEAANKLVKWYGKEYVATIGLSELEEVLTKDEIMEEFKEN